MAGVYSHPKTRKSGCPVSISWAGDKAPKCFVCGRRMIKKTYKRKVK